MQPAARRQREWFCSSSSLSFSQGSGHHLCCILGRSPRELSCALIILWSDTRQTKNTLFLPLFPSRESPCVLAKSLQWCLTLFDPMDFSPLGSSVLGFLQERILARVAYALLQGTFLTQGSNPGLLLGRWILYHWATRGAHCATRKGDNESISDGLFLVVYLPTTLEQIHYYQEHFLSLS